MNSIGCYAKTIFSVNHFPQPPIVFFLTAGSQQSGPIFHLKPSPEPRGRQSILAAAAARNDKCGTGGRSAFLIPPTGSKQQPITTGENRSVIFRAASPSVFCEITRSRQGPKRAGQFSAFLWAGNAAVEGSTALILPSPEVRLASLTARAQFFNSSVFSVRERAARGATHGKLYMPVNPDLERAAL